ncbi:uncharacterized protein N7479_010810 [Penicillium vulpinum]|uniref:uncharacterized protein n=1 Tax=Penicillium vulpinum TaxID=29845 RepID=UPI0025494B91|nr:uncharacterized protein N7479_010810 [Penicillium vulpinum]KAJ5952397.1 hypothetical protein N7479_010810 [Penicillium vulpinum]
MFLGRAWKMPLITVSSYLLHVFYFLQGCLPYDVAFSPAIFYPCEMPSQPSKSDEPKNYSETCLLCGIYILTFDGGTISHDHLDVFKESQWEIYRKSTIPEHILVPSTELENKIFSKFPWLSSCYQRGETFKFEAKRKFKLSDMPILQYMNSRELAQLHVLVISRTSFQETKIPDEFLDERRYHRAHWMQISLYKHKNMGYILGHLVGKELIEKRLGQVVQAVRMYWQTHKGWGVTDTDTLFRAQLDGAIYARCESYVRGCDIFSFKMQSNLPKIRLPLEISLQVAEIICPIIYAQSDVQNMRNMLSVFALNLPDAF